MSSHGRLAGDESISDINKKQKKKLQNLKEALLETQISL
jgi:hypothetical protein